MNTENEEDVLSISKGGSVMTGMGISAIKRSPIVEAVRYHDFSYGHRVYGHENKCSHLHGHNSRVHFYIEGNQDSVGRVLDFSVIKVILCQWLEDNWDHKFLVFDQDPWADTLLELDNMGVVKVPFNPTAENMALYLLEVVAPSKLKSFGLTCSKVEVEETRKCKATAYLPDNYRTTF